MGSNADTNLRTAGDDIYLDIGGEHWRLSFASARQVPPGWFVHVNASGPRVCAFTIKLRGRPDNADGALRIVSAIAAWLRSGDSRAHVYLDGAMEDLPAPPEPVCPDEAETR